MSDEAKRIFQAFYEKSKKEVVDYMEVTPQVLGMEEDIFNKALKELEVNGNIKGVLWGEDNQPLYDDINIMVYNKKD